MPHGRRASEVACAAREREVILTSYSVCLFGFTTNIYYMFPEGSPESGSIEARAEAEGAGAGEHHYTTYTMAIGFFIAQRFFVALWYIWVGFLVPMIKGSMFCGSVIIVVASALWIVSIHVPWPNQLAPIFLAIFVDLFGGSIIIWITRKSKDDKSMCRHLTKVCSFSRLAPSIS